MQILKEEIRNRIMEEAERLFYKQGFEATSTRQMAKACNISPSNLYRYFDSKEHLFEDLMQGYQARLIEGLQRFLMHEEQNVDSEPHIDALARALSEIINLDRRKFVILMDGSRGTAYQHVRQTLIKAISQRMASSAGKAFTEKRAIREIIAENFFNGILQIARISSGEEELYDNLTVLATYHLGGVGLLANP